MAKRSPMSSLQGNANKRETQTADTILQQIHYFEVYYHFRLTHILCSTKYIIVPSWRGSLLLSHASKHAELRLLILASDKNQVCCRAANKYQMYRLLRTYIQYAFRGTASRPLSVQQGWHEFKGRGFIFTSFTYVHGLLHNQSTPKRPQTVI